MATRYKTFIPNEIYFITFTILGWNNIFTNDEYCSLVYKWFDYIKRYDNEINGYVIMPNHIHCLMKISERSPIPAKLIQNAKRFLAYQIVEMLEKDNNDKLLNFFKNNAKIKKGALHKVFTDGYDLLPIQSRKIFLEKLNYIHNNPCQMKWSLADQPEDYRYSSASNYINDNGVYNIKVIDF